MEFKLSRHIAVNRCGLGKGAQCCSYLVATSSGMCADFVCAKQTPAEPEIMLKRISKSVESMGDNCTGYPHWAPTIPGGKFARVKVSRKRSTLPPLPR